MTDASDVRRQSRLVIAGWSFAAGTAIHVIDHLRRGQGSVTETLYVLGNMALVLQVVTIVLIVVGHRVAPMVATVTGISLTVGFVLAHWLPEWSSMSDPVWDVDSLKGLTYVASAAEIVTALAVGIAGYVALRARGLESVVATPS